MKLSSKESKIQNLLDIIINPDIIALNMEASLLIDLSKKGSKKSD